MSAPELVAEGAQRGDGARVRVWWVPPKASRGAGSVTVELHPGGPSLALAVSELPALARGVTAALDRAWAAAGERWERDGDGS